MPPDAAQDQPPEPDRLEAAADQAIAACGGDARAAVKALMVANEYLESEVCVLTQACRTPTREEDSRPIPAKAMEDKKNRDRSNVRYLKRPKRLVSRTRLVMGLLLVVAIPILIGLANKAVRENGEAIRQELGR